MSSASFAVAAPLAGGQLCSGMTIVLTAQMMWEHGLTIGIYHDKRRQILLNLICFVCALNTTISYGYNATKASVLVSDLTTIITFLSVQYSLVILNHNTIIRAANIFTKGHISRERLDRYCTVLYILPPIVLIPIYFAFADKFGSDQPLNTSTWNSTVYKPLNIALIMITAVLATVTDIMLLNKVDAHFRTFANQGPNDGNEMRAPGTAPSTNSKLKEQLRERRKKIALRKDLWMNYAVTWTLLIADVVLKAVIAAGIPSWVTQGTSSGHPTGNPHATYTNTVVASHGMQPSGIPTTSGVYNPGFPISKVSQPVSKVGQQSGRQW
ncbi:hypothetical protein BCR44DRAFT_1427979 [Catenaria anguillulae PL171]|uniref:Uncharacterized protein n=1 Tax=Catenaria anguillulae PL171 TaxID=765915 RepID=A0A1Y2HWA9_9FUNG|nr:hypothetical protein BCR44DRAFT_1427979 [Catenaria anguillulae PL171]